MCSRCALAPERTQQHLSVAPLEGSADLPPEATEQLGAVTVVQTSSVAADEAGCFVDGPPPGLEDQGDQLAPVLGVPLPLFVNRLGGRQPILVGTGTPAWSVRGAYVECTQVMLQST